MRAIVSVIPHWLALIIVCIVALAAAPGSLQASGPRHEGVATCASTTCHGAARPLNATPVLQNEYVTWSTFDPHASAFRTLRDERSATIARRLGIGDASQAQACLACHSEVVAVPERGPKFQADDGIGCEACHGAAQDWLATHDDGARGGHTKTQGLGLRALNDARVRGATCTGCHVGSADRAATHAMMAAGHPRLSFELDTFTELWRTSGGREHFRRDADYASRKPEAGATQVWLTGLLLSSRYSVDQVEAAVSRGALPEFAAFNCYSCHRSMGLDRWQERGPGSTPGALRVNDSALRLLATAVEAWQPDQALRLTRGIETLQKAANDERAAVGPAAEALHRLLAGLEADLEKAPPGPADRQQILLAVLRASARGAYPDYATAEQAAMAAVVLLADTGNPARRSSDVEALFAALDDDAAFDQARFARILGRLAVQSAGAPGSLSAP